MRKLGLVLLSIFIVLAILIPKYGAAIITVVITLIGILIGLVAFILLVTITYLFVNFIVRKLSNKTD